MAKSTPARKTRNPNKLRRRMLRRNAAKCHLARWESSSDGYGYFHSFGPFDSDTVFELTNWAMHQTEKWTCMVVSVFIDNEGNYYEEMTTLPPRGGLKLAADAGTFDELVKAAIQDAKTSGNPQHYKDTVVILRLHTPELEINLEDDNWLNKQAAFRAEIFYTDTVDVDTQLKQLMA